MTMPTAIPFRQGLLLKLLIGGSILAPSLLFGAAAWQTYVDVFRAAQARADHVCEVIEEHTLKTFETIALALDQTENRVRAVGIDEFRRSRSIWTETAQLQKRIEQADSIYVLDANGDLVMTTRAFPTPMVNFADRDYFVEQKIADQGLYISKAYVGRISGRQIFNLSIRHRSETGEFAGVVGSSAYISYYDRFFEKFAEPGAMASIRLVRDDGEVIVQHPVATRDGPSISLAEKSHESLATGSDEYLVTSRPVRGFPFHVVYIVEKRAILKSWYERLLWWGALTATLGSFLFAVSLLAFRRANAEHRAVKELHNQMKQRELAEAQLRHAQKMEALGHLTGGVAHDFNNLLQIIIGGIYRLRRKGGPEIVPTLDLVDRAAHRSAHLTRQLLSFARRQTLNPEPLDIKSKISELAPFLKQALRPDINLNFMVGESLWPVEIDATEFEVAMINLASNARDAMPNGGEFEIRVANVHLAGGETPEGLTGQNLEICVSDTGCGIPLDVIERVFDPFFTTKGSNQGTGLGLSQVYGFVRQCGGSAIIRSAAGMGTTVTLYLPRSKKCPADTADKSNTAPPGSSEIRILMVEDNAAVGKVGAEMLRDLGYRVDLVANGLAALEVLARSAKNYDLVFSDIVMPGGMSGRELQARIERTYPDLAVVLTSGYSHDEIPQDDQSIRILRKPYEPSNLKQALEEALTRRRASALTSVETTASREA